MNEKTMALLYSAGFTGNYIGFYHLASAVEQAAQEPSHLLTITKTLYPNVAQQFQTDWRSVERNIRTAVSAAWAQSPGRLEQVAGHPFPAKPSAAQVIAVLSNCLQTA